MQGIAGKVAIVAGGATSIGAEIVRYFVDAGARVVIADVENETGTAFSEEMGNNVAFVHTDLRIDTDIRNCISEAVGRYGQIDFVVNAACIYRDNGAQSTREDWLDSLNVNLVGGVMLVRFAHEHLKKSKGAVVNLGSISGKVAQKGRWTYPASKAAIHQVTRNQALDFAEDGIRVNTVSPGWTWSGVMEKAVAGNRAIIDGVAEKFHLIARAGNRDEVAAIVVFLCSSHASFVTGADWPVDGGYSAIGPEGMDAVMG